MTYLYRRKNWTKDQSFPADDLASQIRRNINEDVASTLEKMNDSSTPVQEKINCISYVSKLKVLLLLSDDRLLEQMGYIKSGVEF